MLAATGVMALVGASAAWAQSTAYYLTERGTRQMYVVQGGNVIRQWTMRDDEAPLAVVDTVRTYGWYPADTGAEYTLTGTWTGTTYPNASGSPTVQRVDGTTDGVNYNFLAAYESGEIWRYNRNWQNPVRLFTINGRANSVAYDTSTGHLWVVGQNPNYVYEYTLSGNIVRQWSYTGYLQCLAYEAATDTLWATEWQSGHVYQYGKNGTRLQDLRVPALDGKPLIGGEMPIATLQLGACCFSNGSCQALTQSQCSSQGGTWQGAGTGCAPNPCPQPTGACCFADGTCSELAEAACLAASGQWQGIGTGCDPNPCPQPGACCFADGTCQLMQADACSTAGGTWNGAASCDPNPCGGGVVLCPGDMNCDGEVTFGDIDLFVEALAGQENWTHWPCPWLNGDCTGDEDVTFADIDCFVSLIGTTCP